MKILSFLLFGLLAIVAFAVVSLNIESTTFDYYFGLLELPLAVLLFIFLIGGLVVGFVAAMGMVLRLKQTIYDLRKQLKATEG